MSEITYSAPCARTSSTCQSYATNSAVRPLGSRGAFVVVVVVVVVVVGVVVAVVVVGCASRFLNVHRTCLKDTHQSLEG